MTPKHLSLLILAVVACAAAQNEDEFNIPYFEKDNQYPLEKNFESDLPSSVGLVEESNTQTTPLPDDDNSYTTESAGNFTTEAPSTSESWVEDTQLSTSEDTVPIEPELSELEVNDDSFVTSETTTELIQDTEAPFSTTVTSPDVTLPDVTSPDVTLQDVTTVSLEEVTTNTEPVDDLTSLITLSDNEEQSIATTLKDINETSDGSTSSEPSTATETSVLDEEVQSSTTVEEPIDTTMSDDITQTVSTDSTTINEEILGDSETNVGVFNALLPNDVDLKETTIEAITESASDVTSKTNDLSDGDLPIDLNAANVDDDVPMLVDTELSQKDIEEQDVPTDVSDQLSETGEGSLVVPLIPVTTEFTTTVIDEELSSTTLGEAVTEDVSTSPVEEPSTDNLVPIVTEVTTTAVDEELHTTTLSEVEATKTGNSEAVNPLFALFSVASDVVSKSVNGNTTSEDQSELLIRSNKADAVSPLTLQEGLGEIETQEKDVAKIDNKKEDVSVGATTSVDKAGGVNKSVIGLIVGGMLFVVAGITIKKNWKSIKNKFSSTPRPANDRTNHTNGITPEEVPLQNKDENNPSPV